MPNRTVSVSQLKDIASSVMFAAEAETLEQVLLRIAEVSRQLINARYAALGVPDGKGGLQHFKVAGMDEEEIENIHHPPEGKGLLGAIMNEQETLRLRHMHEDPRAVGFPEGHPHMESLLGMPIIAGEQLFGMLYLTDREDGEPFTQEDQWLVESLAGYAALAIAGRQLSEQRRRLSLLEERQRIGMELHDGIIQSLYALGMQVDLIRGEHDLPEETFQPVIDGLNDVIEEIRNYIMHLSHGTEESRSCREMLENVINRLYIPESLSVTVNAPTTQMPFSQEKSESVCMIVREAISNVVRHADAAHVTITAYQNRDHLSIFVSDNGSGFDPGCLSYQEGLGIRNMKERANLHDGTLEIESEQGSGTTVKLYVPVKQ